MHVLDIIRRSDRAAAILSPIRLRVLSALRTPGSATTVAGRLGIPRQKANYHVRTLERLGLVRHVEDRKKGNCTERVVQATATHYLIAPSVVGELEPSPSRQADTHSSDHLAAVCARTVSQLAELTAGAETAGKRLPTLSVETAVRFASPEDQQAFTEAVAHALTTLVHRYHDEHAEGGRWFRFLLGGHPAVSADHPPTDNPSQPTAT
jgi:Helix-turn-helix domain